MSKFGKKLARLKAAGLAPLEGSSNEQDKSSSHTRTHEVSKAPETAGVHRARDKPGVAAKTLTSLLGALPKSAPVVEPSLVGERVTTEHGELHIALEHLSRDACHGAAPVLHGLTSESELMALLSLDRAFSGVDGARMLFIDTETTGLSTAAGTLAPLVGCAFFEDERLVVEQMLLTKRHEESIMLRHLADRLQSASMIVSYNGKSFDWPLLRSRFVMSRVETPRLPPHLDLLHCARRVFKRRLRSMRLVEMEREVLAYHRVGDFGGAAIPPAFLRFLKFGTGIGDVNRILEHNRHDLVALSAFLGAIVDMARQVRAGDDSRDHLSIALLSERGGDSQRAKAFADAASSSESEKHVVEALLLKARVARREKDVDAENMALLSAIELTHDPRIHLELAKHFEHRKKDLRSALKHARLTCPAETTEACEHRVRRIERRLQKR